MHDFERDVLKGGYNPVNKKLIAEKLIKFFDDQLKERVNFVPIDSLEEKDYARKKMNERYENGLGTLCGEGLKKDDRPNYLK
jgi:hypothetical protein